MNASAVGAQAVSLHRLRYLSIALALSIAVSGCAGDAALLRGHAAQGGAWVRSELLFGFSRHGERPVSDAEWRAFVKDEVASRFPKGFTVFEGNGHWLDASGVHDEDARVLLLVRPTGADADRRLEEIRAIYCARFRQDSVLRVDTPAEVRF
jgi:hypothetical protein